MKGRSAPINPHGWPADSFNTSNLINNYVNVERWSQNPAESEAKIF